MGLAARPACLPAAASPEVAVVAASRGAVVVVDAPVEISTDSSQPPDVPDSQPVIDSAEFHITVSPVLTASQTVFFDNECAMPVYSKVGTFAIITKVVIAGLLTCSILWLDGTRCERK